MKRNGKLLLPAIALSLFLICLLAAGPAWARRGGSGSKSSKTSAQGRSAQGSRNAQGANADSEYCINGKRTTVSGSSQSTVKPGSAQGEATIGTSGGKSATMKGSATVDGDTASGSGSVQTAAGKGAEFSGSAEKGESGMNTSGSMTTNSGKTVDASVEGTKESGTVTVETDKGEKSYQYGNGNQYRHSNRYSQSQ